MLPAAGATVSRALSEPSQLHAGTLARVNDAVRQSGGCPCLVVHTLGARRAMLALVLVPDIAGTSFSGVLHSVEDTPSRQG